MLCQRSTGKKRFIHQFGPICLIVLEYLYQTPRHRHRFLACLPAPQINQDKEICNILISYHLTYLMCKQREQDAAALQSATTQDWRRYNWKINNVLSNISLPGKTENSSIEYIKSWLIDTAKIQDENYLALILNFANQSGWLDAVNIIKGAYTNQDYILGASSQNIGPDAIDTVSIDCLPDGSLQVSLITYFDQIKIVANNQFQNLTPPIQFTITFYIKLIPSVRNAGARYPIAYNLSITNNYLPVGFPSLPNFNNLINTLTDFFMQQPPLLESLIYFNKSASQEYLMQCMSNLATEGSQKLSQLKVLPSPCASVFGNFGDESLGSMV